MDVLGCPMLPCFQGNENLESFLIDELLDFTNDDDDADIGGPIEFENSASTLTEEFSPSASLDGNSCSSEAPEPGQLPASMLCVPTDTLADLEWLSTFEEDVFLLPDTNAYVPAPSADSCKSTESKTESLTQRCKFTYNFHAPSRARSKRSRPSGPVWSYEIPLLITNNGARSEASLLSFECSDTCSSTVGRPPKKPKKKANGIPSAKRLQSATADGPNLRKCSHCHVTKTPQWRAGPLGPKTLCNACGVRYKSGRLVPEYRPALSPTFVSEIHSNSHRKILEMRRLKEQQQQQFPSLQEKREEPEQEQKQQEEQHEDSQASSISENRLSEQETEEKGGQHLDQMPVQ
eukprot:TRINITY_DN8907_c0_g2_i1.p1 TRINITY_DN8907_c0_g2~~TRINITY_DN8907_c0_g2_i1.p1  ORF type:complete len:348 (+),score=18.71 TRINITY_DN8907_c0_g2_i1:475-1518(+)